MATHTQNQQLVSSPIGALPADVTAAGLPPAITSLGPDACERFVAFFVGNIRNPNTRTAYARAVWRFFAWHKGSLHEVTPVHVAAYVELLGTEYAPPSVKQHLAAIRMLFDYLVVGQVMPSNPAHAVRGPKHVVKKGKTPILSAPEIRELFDAIPSDTAIGKRDRALLGVLFYAFARVSAAVGLDKGDIYVQKRRMWIRLREKGGKVHEMPCHHTLEDYLTDYLENTPLSALSEPSTPLFYAMPRRSRGAFTARRLLRQEAGDVVRRRLARAGIATRAANHMFRASGITIYLENGGLLEHAQQMAAHESPRTTKLYDRTSDRVSLDEIEKIIV